MSRATTRLRHLLAANLHAMLDRAEDPEKMLRAIVQEMDDTRAELERTCSELRTTLKAADNDSGRFRRRMAHWQAEAEQALAQGDEERARAAVAQRHDAEQAEQKQVAQASELRVALQRVEDDLARLAASREQAAEYCRSLAGGRRHERLQARYQSPADACLARSRERIERIERRIERMESQIESYDLSAAPASPPPAPAVDATIEQELAALKARLAG